MTNDIATGSNEDQMDSKWILWRESSNYNQIIYKKPNMKVARVGGKGIDGGYFCEVKRSN